MATNQNSENTKGQTKGIFEGRLVGHTMEWEKSGRARRELAKGEVIAEVPEGMTNREAFDIIKREKPYTWNPYRSSYERFADDTHTTKRVIIAVKNEDSSRRNDSYLFYAPNKLEVYPA